ncbi:hypothetical protein [Parathermosynechococcus lividus]|uniref:hypothetical protein n=1 Tax=Parathermosynechococcus lividus TaxID=33070 RepID=UPI0012FE39A8|nr:hypothetical protein [Thermostichus lividus]
MSVRSFWDTGGVPGRQSHVASTPKVSIPTNSGTKKLVIMITRVDFMINYILTDVVSFQRRLPDATRLGSVPTMAAILSYG